MDWRYRASVNCADTLTDGVENLCENLLWCRGRHYTVGF
jgi:hypothetical protein